MADYTELKRLAEAANVVTSDTRVEMTIASEPGPNQAEIDAVTAFMGAATPAAVLALIAENERLRADYAGLARFNPEWDRVAAAQDSVREHMAMVVQLKAEIAGLKTGNEAYEQVNAELKAENEELRKGLAGMLDMHLIAGRAALGQGEQS